MQITVLTLFPEMFSGPLTQSIIRRATEKGFVNINFINPRDFSHDKYKSVDDRPYGGGKGMIMRIDILVSALESITKNPKFKNQKTRIILLDPRGKTYNQKKANSLTKYDHLILIAGHYEGIDERFRKYTDETISIGDYVLTGGEIPAMVIIDSIVRLLPGVLASTQSVSDESFQHGQIEYPQYTRPEEFRGNKVPAILLSGNHAQISKWKNIQSAALTKKFRPDLKPLTKKKD